MEISVNFDQQIAELKAELALRQNVYRKWVIAGKMNRQKADMKYAALRAALHVLLEIQAVAEDRMGRMSLAPPEIVAAVTPACKNLARERVVEGLWR